MFSRGARCWSIRGREASTISAILSLVRDVDDEDCFVDEEEDLWLTNTNSSFSVYAAEGFLGRALQQASIVESVEYMRDMGMEERARSLDQCRMD